MAIKPAQRVTKSLVPHPSRSEKFKTERVAERLRIRVGTEWILPWTASISICSSWITTSKKPDEQDHILGFGQWGQPTFIYEKGQKASTDRVGVIRHLYFDPGRDDVGTALLRQAREDLAGLCEIYAFYHIFGMSCNARHGKLHSSQAHVEQLLRAAGFDIEHENEYYLLDMKKPMVFRRSGEQKGQLKHVSDEHFELWQGGERVGTAQVQWLDKLTGGWTRNAVYLSWLGIAECTRGQGLGTGFLRMIGDRLRESGYRYLHTDTAQSNEKAQSLYERLGFESKGSTRSYVWNQNCALIPDGL